MALEIANAYELLSDDNDGDMEEFLNKVTEEAKVTAAEETKKKRLAKEEKAKRMQEEKLEANHVVGMGAKIPVIPKRLHRSHVVFRKQKPEDQESKDQEISGDVKETEKSGENNHTQRDNAGNNNQGKYQENHERRNYERRNLFRENNNGGEKDQRVVKEEGSYRKNYGGFHLYNQDNNNKSNGGEGFFPRRGGRGGGRGRGFGRRDQWRHSNGNHMSSSENRNDHEQNQIRAEVSDNNVEKKELGDHKEEQPMNGDNGAESKEEEKKNKRKSKKENQEEEIEPSKTMTYEEYEEVLLEKKKALQALVDSEQKQKASLDKNEFESMIAIGKKTEKPNSTEDKATKKDRVGSNKEKGSMSKSMSIDEFCGGYGGRGSRGGRYGGRNNEIRGGGRAFSSQPPKVEDEKQFPALK